MTSPSLKNHPITALLNPIRSKAKSRWKQLLAGALCLVMAGQALSVPAGATDKEPLERLKQRSPRLRWRELKGEWVPAPETPGHRGRREATPVAPEHEPEAPPRVASNPFEAPASTAPQSVVVPEPHDAIPEVAAEPMLRPSAKPAPDRNEPLDHPGRRHESVAGSTPDKTTPAARPMPRDPDQEHWPFRENVPPIETLQVFDEPRISVPAPAEPEPVRVAELPTERPAGTVLSRPELAEPSTSSPLNFEAAPAAAVTLEPSLPSNPPTDTAPMTPEPAVVSQEPDAIRVTQEPTTNSEAPLQDTGKDLPTSPEKSIRTIRPFFNYVTTHQGTESNRDNRHIPQEIDLTSRGNLERNAPSTAVYWQASNVTHNPLYFEDVGLERSGHTFSECVQPFVSVGRFGAQIVALPYSLALDPAWKQESTLGHHRPGECQTPRHLAVPLNGEAAATAAAAYTGIIFLIP